MNSNLSSADLLTLQVLERELTEPNISKDYEGALRARVEYLGNKVLDKGIKKVYNEI
jgi:hypothetical protein